MLRGVPFTRILLSFLAGVLIEIWLQPNVNWSLTLLVFSSLFFSLYILFPRLITYRTQFLSGILLSTSIFCCGLLVTHYNTTSNCTSYFAKVDSPEYYLASINEEMLEKPNSYKTILKIEAVRKNGVWKDSKGKVLVYFKKYTTDLNLNYGSKIIFSNTPVIIDEPSNPHQFNYKRYLSFHNTYHQVYLDQNNYFRLGESEPRDIYSFSYDVRNKLLAILKSKLPSVRENAVAAALVLGYGEGIDNELIDAYSGAGAMHVLCVSGLHVGIIFIVLSRLLVFFEKKKLKPIKFILLIAFIWFYALITGLSPSVSRASTMITLVILGTWYRGGTTNIYNTLIVSIFVLLLFNPYLITEVGFQLSYLAVFGIIYIHPKIYNQFTSSSYLWNRIWEITSVSISAQLATFPLAALYFHKFPNLFLVSNLFVIPIATLIIYGTILLMLFSWTSFLSNLIAKLLAGLIWFLNEIVLWIEKVPYSVVEGISWSVIETWLVYGLITFGVLFLVRKSAIYFQGALAVIVLLLIISTYDSSFVKKQNKLVVYDINNTTAVDLISGNENYLIADDQLINDKNSIRFNILQNWYWMDVKKNNLVALNANRNDQWNDNPVLFDKDFILFQNKRIAIKEESELNSISQDVQTKINLDLLILRYNNKTKVKSIKSKYNVSQIVLDSSWPNWKTLEVKNELSAQGFRVHAVGVDKAFEWNL